MTEKSLWGRIPAEEVGEVQSWTLPPIYDHGTVLPSFEKEEKERLAAEQQSENETIETIEVDSIPESSGPTLEELQQIFDEAERDGFAKGHQEGSTKGHSEGFEAGRQQAYQEFKAKLLEEQARFKQLADALEQPLANQADQLETMMVKSISLLTQSVVKRELSIDTSHITQLVRDAIEALPVGYKQLNIIVNSADLTLLKDYATEHQMAWQIQSDDSMAQGGLRIETLESRIDDRVETRLQHILKQFATKQLAQSPSDDPQDDHDDVTFEAEPDEDFSDLLGLDPSGDLGTNN